MSRQHGNLLGWWFELVKCPLALLCDFLQQSLAVCSGAGSGEGIAKAEEHSGDLGKSGVGMMYDKRERTEVSGLDGSMGLRLSHAERRGS